MFFVAVLRDRHAFDQLHDEVRPAAVGRAGIQHFGDIRMVHHRHGLPLGLEAGDHLPRVHPRLDDLERDRPLNRLGLLGHEHDAHAAFADLLQQLVGADDRAGLFGDGLVDRGDQPAASRPRKLPARSMCPQQVVDLGAQVDIVRRTLRPGTRSARHPSESQAACQKIVFTLCSSSQP